MSMVKALTELKAKTIIPGDPPLNDGTVRGLHLWPGPAKGRGKWVLRYTSPVTGKRRDMGFGAFPEVGLADARRRALEARRLIADSKDPINFREDERAARKAAATAKTFEQAALEKHGRLRKGWKNAKHADQWINTLKTYAFPAIGKRKVVELTLKDFAEVLRPIWLEKPETATRVRQRLHAVMSYSLASGYHTDSPFDDRALDDLLPRQEGKRTRIRHQPAMPWRDIPPFIETLRAGDHNVTRALLEFVILTAARSGEARAMTWAEVNLTSKVWTVPAERMKAKEVHQVPLSNRALEILKTQREKYPDSEIVFPSQRGVVLSDMVLTKFLRDNKIHSDEPGRTATAHGFRSSFRDWASESGYPRDVAERALAHTIKNETEAAYHRTDLLEQRRIMMQAWSQHLNAEATPTVVPLRADSRKGALR
jgi:integrase